MALINNIYVHVKSGNESWDEGVESTSHPVEKGFEITDTIRKKPISLSISGEIVDYGSVKAMSALAKLKELKDSGSLITYTGRRAAKNLQIQSFNYDFSNEIWGGCTFSMSLKEVKIAKKAYVKQKTTTNVSPKITPKVGDIVVFKGGNVYVSSDAPKAATTKGRQSCEVTKINTASWSLHDYHLISVDKKYPNNVYGWVDGADIEGVTESGEKTNTTSQPVTNDLSNGGTPQVQQKGNEVFVELKLGESFEQAVWEYSAFLITEYGTPITPEWVKSRNTALTGERNLNRRIFMGYREIPSSPYFSVGYTKMRQHLIKYGETALSVLTLVSKPQKLKTENGEEITIE